MPFSQKQWCVLLVAASVLGCSRVDASREQGKPAPELNGGLTWLNTTPVKLADVRGKVVLLDFFEYSCVNCIRTLPYVNEWRKRYGSDGLLVVGVHTPQYEFSMDPQNVNAGAHRLGITFPVVVDSNFHIADAYGNRFSPRLFLIDKAGTIRFDHTGEGAYEETELMIQKLLHEIDPAKTFPPPMAPVRATDRAGAVCYPVTTELYLGQVRGRLGNAGNGDSNSPAFFTLPNTMEEGLIYAAGEWDNRSEYLRHTRDTDEPQDLIALRYRATEVNVVMKPEDVYWMRVYVKQDGDWLPREIAGEDIKYDDQGRSYAEAKSARMYSLISKQPYSQHDLRLIVQTRGLSAYSFSFGTAIMPAAQSLLSEGATH